MIRKGQVRWLAKGDVIGQVRFIHQVYGSLRDIPAASFLALPPLLVFATHPLNGLHVGPLPRPVFYRPVPGSLRVRVGDPHPLIEFVENYSHGELRSIQYG
jgi:hypothetical protein